MDLRHILKFNTISKKFLIPTLFLTAILLGGLGAVIVKNDYDAVRSIMISKGNSLANLLSEISTVYMLDNDSSALDRFVKQALKDPEVEFAVFYNIDKQPLTESSKEPEDTSSLLVYERDLKSSGGRTLGYLKLGYTQKTISNNLRRGIQEVVVSTAAALLLLSFGMTFLFRGITRPLGHLVAVTRSEPALSSTS